MNAIAQMLSNDIVLYAVHDRYKGQSEAGNHVSLRPSARIRNAKNDSQCLSNAVMPLRAQGPPVHNREQIISCTDCQGGRDAEYSPVVAIACAVTATRQASRLEPIPRTKEWNSRENDKRCDS